ncbi:sugar transferase [Phenylobacterium sp.]|uniref:sugar transferase n=1 Tax=Phenylobacterium sp. TaxID=1871053 RepID=UPI002810EC92|nr:sugar transferase [Phenylobacterium sp.]
MTMLMKPIGDIQDATPLGRERADGGALIAFVAAAAFIALWSLGSVLLIRGVEMWASSPEYLLHLAINTGCMALAAAYAARVHGSLDYKLGQALLTVFLLFGAYALAVLGGRLFFSRPMLFAAVTGGALVSCLVVLLRHRLARRRVAIVGPLIGDVRPALPFGQVVNDPQTDLRGFDIVLVSLTEQVSAEWSKALSRAMLAGCKVRHVGEYIEELRGAVSLDHFDVDHLPPNGIASYKALKRAMDIGLVVFILPVALPVMALAMAAVFVTMGRPIFFVQERVGLGGEPFRMWKLRTMRPEREGEALKAAVVGDARVTPIGRILRRFRVDELPQLWNVLKGDMSLIGPRPEAVALHEQYLARLPNYAYRYLVRPGITGWAQVSAPPSANAEEARTKLTYDLFYVKKLSLYLDLQIVIRTFWTITAGGGVR